MAVMPNSIDTNKFNPSKRSQGIRNQYLKAPNEFFIGVVARLEPGKGVFETLAVAEKLRHWKIPFQLVIFGDEPVGEPGFRAVMEEAIQKLQLRHSVQLPGYHKDIDAVIASLDVLLHPSPAETFGRVIIEAMAWEWRSWPAPAAVCQPSSPMVLMAFW